MRFSNEELKQLRSNCKNGMHLSAKVLSMFEHRAVMVGIDDVTNPAMEEHRLAITVMQTPPRHREVAMRYDQLGEDQSLR